MSTASVRTDLFGALETELVPEGAGSVPVMPLAIEEQPRPVRKSEDPEPVPVSHSAVLSFFTIGRKITIAQIGVVFLALLLASTAFFFSVKSDLERMLSQRLENIARTSTLLLQGEDHEEVVQAFIKGGPADAVASPGFQKFKAALERVQKNNELTSDVYTLIDAERFSDMYEGETKAALKGNMMFMAMATKKDPYVGNMMPMHEKVREVFKTGGFARTKLYSDAEGTWVSAFAPVLDANGKTVAVLEFDYNAEHEVKEANKQLIISILIPAALGLLLAVVLGSYIGRSLSTPIRTLSDVAELVAGGNFDVSVDVTTRDETGALGTVFNKMVSDLKKQRLELQDYAQNLEKKIAERTAQLSDANRSIQGMVDSVGQGFFMFDQSGTCLPIYSRACEALLESAPAGKPVWESLRVEGTLQDDVKSWYPLLFEDLMPFEEVSVLGPKTLPAGKADKFVTLEYFPVRDDSGKVSRVVAIATDRTAEREANRRADREREFAQMIQKLVKNRKHFAGLVTETKNRFLQLKEELAKATPDLDAVFRSIHTFKSASAAYSMGDVAHTAHEYESELVEIRKQAAAGKAVDFSPWKDKIEHLDGLFQKFLEDNRAILGGATGSAGPSVEVPVRELRALGNKLEQLVPGNRAAIFKILNYFLSEPIEALLVHYNEVVNLTATVQQKEVGDIEFEGGGFRVMPDPLAPLMGSMIHAFRNAVDHGLETPEERIEKAKPPTGKIVVRLSQEKRGERTWVVMQVIDDGRGIDPAILRKKLAEKGLKGIDAETDQQVIQHVFDAGFSTKDQVTDISGRGVGMDAIRASVLELGGSCQVVSVVGSGTTLTVEFPDPEPIG